VKPFGGRMNKKFVALVFLFVFKSISALAEAQSGVSFRIHHPNTSLRALGMGDAFVAVSDDYSALYYNPAGLARRKDGEMNFAIEMGLSSSFLDVLSGLSTASNKPGTTDQKNQYVMDEITKLYGQSFMGRGGLNGVWVRPGWGIGVSLLELTTEMSVHKQAGPAVNTTMYLDSNISYGYGTNVTWFENAETSVGLTGKFVNRGYFSKSINFMEIATDPNLVKTSDLQEGYTMDLDLGMLYTPEIPESGIFQYLKYTKPTFGFVARNILEVGFGQSLKLLNKETSSPPEKMYRVLDIGSRWEYPKAWIFGGRGTLDFRDIGHPYMNFRKSLHLGFEFDWTMFSWWRGGYRFGLNQGYLTAGLSALFTFFNLDLVTYSEDVGSFDTPIENRVYALKMNINI